MPRSKHSRTRDGAVTLDGSGAPVARSSHDVAEIQVPSLNGIARESAAGALTTPAEDEFWSFKAVVARTGLSRSSIYSYVAQGLFPRQRRLGPRRVGWLASEVRAWIASRPP